MILDTLAQNETTLTEFALGTGCKVVTPEERERRGKTKLIGNSVALALIDVAKVEGDTSFIQKAWNTFHCMSEVQYCNGLIFGKYCKNRFCPTCLGIRKAELIRKYYPVLSKWRQPYFLTLTIKSCIAEKLEFMINLQRKAFSKIINRNKSKVRRGKGRRIIALRSQECNFNADEGWYNPHFHLIVPDYKTAHYLAYNWQSTINDMVGYKISNNAGQDFRRITDLETQLIETIKYGTKIFTEQDGESENVTDAIIYAKAFYTVLKAFEGKRLLSTFGFTLPDEVKKRPQIITQLNNPSILRYDMKENDWINEDTGSMLTQYDPPIELKEILNTIDLELS